MSNRRRRRCSPGRSLDPFDGLFNPAEAAVTVLRAARRDPHGYDTAVRQALAPATRLGREQLEVAQGHMIQHVIAIATVLMDSCDDTEQILADVVEHGWRFDRAGGSADG